jgi:hypothetical protein
LALTRGNAHGGRGGAKGSHGARPHTGRKSPESGSFQRPVSPETAWWITRRVGTGAIQVTNCAASLQSRRRASSTMTGSLRLNHRQTRRPRSRVPCNPCLRLGRESGGGFWELHGWNYQGVLRGVDLSLGNRLLAHLSSDESVRSERERAALAVAGDCRSDAGRGRCHRPVDRPVLAAVPGEHAERQHHQRLRKRRAQILPWV